MSELHDDRVGMLRDPQLIEPDPYSEDPNEMRFRSKDEIEEWVYDKGYDSVNDPFWMIAPTSVVKEIGMLFIREGQDHAREAKYEEIQECIEITVDEHLNSHVDGQMRLYAGYDVAENGDTLEEGDYSKWENLRTIYEAGVRDALCDVERYASI